jgi:tetraprenyl-beta-curcumene synthase
VRALQSDIGWAIRRVLFSRERLAFLVGGGMDDLLELRRFLVHVVPLARCALQRLEGLAERIPDAELRAQAHFGLRAKAYHVAGACILATLLPSGAREHYVEIVAPLEAIYDFLDGLCDRHPLTTPAAFRQLHFALADALDPAQPLRDYYAFGPPGDDGEYLASLVRAVRRALGRLGDYELLLPHFREAAQLYADTQTYKHLAPPERAPAFEAWHARETRRFGDLTWWELAAAAGSQFQVYGPLYAAFCSSFDVIGTTYAAYFPAFSALHVLLDSFIDQQEDRDEGELNWIQCYDSFDAFCARASEFARRAREAFAALPMPRAHTFALRTMALFYLTHPKVYDQQFGQEATALLDALA